MSSPISDAKVTKDMSMQMSVGGSSKTQEQGSRDTTPVHQDALISTEKVIASEGIDATEFTSPPPNFESPHQLLKEAAIIKLQSALKWADMMDDIERDKALIAQEGVWHNSAKDNNAHLKKATKEKIVGSGERNGYPNTRSNKKYKKGFQ
ncbi:hypothetical protein GIB67_017381 [Kingdonia uniflora]|uniref:Uncharacterized protein n=1 Tax=Kingdonia uniflora TaxID=39325 RepID=A0A7J7M4F1_9MAGN|nr:hypothetical protein GIB67_017381 [Kingdonia uniflora]